MDFYIDMWKQEIGDNAEILWAKSLEDGEKIFNENPDIAIVIMDCCVPGDTPNSSWLVKEIRGRGFEKPIIAKSSMPEYCQTLIDVGASHSANPYEVPSLILKLLS